MRELSPAECAANDRQRELDRIQRNENTVMACKRLLWEMWYDVEQGRRSACSLYGDRVLELRDALYERNEEAQFYEDYGKFLGRKKHAEKNEKPIELDTILTKATGIVGQPGKNLIFAVLKAMLNNPEKVHITQADIDKEFTTMDKDI